MKRGSLILEGCWTPEGGTGASHPLQTAPDREHARRLGLAWAAAQGCGDGKGFSVVPAQGEQTAATAAHELAGRLQFRQLPVVTCDRRAQPLGRRLQPVVQ